MKQIIDFLNALALNNNREYFAAHKADYLNAQARFNILAEQLLQKIQSFDPQCADLTIKDIIYRIYRDTRFSKDKRPYKTHLGAYICPHGKKSGYAGYYFHINNTIAPLGNDVYSLNHMLALGDYCFEPLVIKTIREDIVAGSGDLDDIITKQINPRFVFDTANSLKRMPKGFEAHTQYADYLKAKAFCIYAPLTTEDLFKPNLIDEIAEMCRSGKPFLDYINRAIRYVKEESTSMDLRLGNEGI